MARRFFQVALLAALIQPGFILTLARAQNPAPQTKPSTGAPASPAASDDGKGEKPIKFRREALTPDQQKRYDSLSPDQQEEMRKNWERWQNMTPAEKKFMLEAEQQRRQKIQQEIDDSIKQSGLQLDDKAKDEYTKRYTQERRKIEKKLQQEMEEKRQPLLKALVDQLKADFQDKSSPSPAPSPYASPDASGTATPGK